jgi:hypothetical protein
MGLLAESPMRIDTLGAATCLESSNPLNIAHYLSLIPQIFRLSCVAVNRHVSSAQKVQ